MNNKKWWEVLDLENWSVLIIVTLALIGLGIMISKKKLMDTPQPEDSILGEIQWKITKSRLEDVIDDKNSKLRLTRTLKLSIPTIVSEQQIRFDFDNKQVIVLGGRLFTSRWSSYINEIRSTDKPITDLGVTFTLTYAKIDNKTCIVDLKADTKQEILEANPDLIYNTDRYLLCSQLPSDF